MPRCFVALGGNIGAVEQTFRDALTQLGTEPETTVTQVSGSYRTRAVGEVAGDDFVNAVAEVDTCLAATALLGRLQSLERQFGRKRDLRWGPRPLDLDLVFYGEDTIDRAELQVPHPACWYRRFVLDPLAEIAPHVVHPTKQITVASLRARLLARPLPVALVGSTPELRKQTQERLHAEFPDVRCELWDGEARFDADPALLFWLGASDDSRPRVADFESLPLLPRFDASIEAADGMLIRNALQAALG